MADALLRKLGCVERAPFVRPQSLGSKLFFAALDLSLTGFEPVSAP